LQGHRHQLATREASEDIAIGNDWGRRIAQGQGRIVARINPLAGAVAAVKAKQPVVTAAHHHNAIPHGGSGKNFAIHLGGPEGLAISGGKGQHIPLGRSHHHQTVVGPHPGGKGLAHGNTPHLLAVFKTGQGAVPGGGIDRAIHHGGSEDVTVRLTRLHLPERANFCRSLEGRQIRHLDLGRAGKGVDRIHHAATGQSGHQGQQGEKAAEFHQASPRESIFCCKICL